MLRPLPPFRVKPLRKPLVPKQASDVRKDAEPISIKARRVPVRLGRLNGPPTLRVLSRDARA